MQYADPFTVKCEKCEIEFQYPLEKVLMFSADCKNCGVRLKECAEIMHQNSRLHNASLWPTHFIFEGLEAFNIDIDTITDEEFDSINTLRIFCNYVEHRIGYSVEAHLFVIPILKELILNYELHELLDMELAKLGTIAYSND